MIGLAYRVTDPNGRVGLVIEVGPDDVACIKYEDENASFGLWPTTDLKIVEVAYHGVPGSTPFFALPREREALERIAATKFCREYDTFTVYCPNCCGEGGHDGACAPCNDHATIRNLIEKLKSGKS